MAENGIDKLLAAIEALGDRLGDVLARVDALEHRVRKDDGRKRDDEAGGSNLNHKYLGGFQPSGYEADRDSRATAAAVQAKADSAYHHWGLRAAAPYSGERPRAYRIRLLQGLQKHSEPWKNVNLIDLEPKALDIAESEIFADSAKRASGNDSMPTARDQAHG
jgi:hypothetical protein